jgi:hypothetical protein
MLIIIWKLSWSLPQSGSLTTSGHIYEQCIPPPLDMDIPFCDAHLVVCYHQIRFRRKTAQYKFVFANSKLAIVYIVGGR